MTTATRRNVEVNPIECVCGTMNTPTALYCNNCGEYLSAEAPTHVACDMPDCTARRRWHVALDDGSVHDLCREHSGKVITPLMIQQGRVTKYDKAGVSLVD